MIPFDDFSDSREGGGGRPKRPEEGLELLTAALSRNVAIITLVAIVLHAAGARAIPNASAPSTRVDVVWLAFMCGMAGVVEIVGVQAQITAYVRAHRKEAVVVDEWWIVTAYAVMAGVVLLLCVLYPVLFVAIKI